MFNGVNVFGINTKGGCKQACIENPSCVALDFDNNILHQPCYIHLDVANLNTQSAANNVDNLVLQTRCGVTTTESEQVCVDSYVAFIGIGSVGAVPASGVFTVQRCQEVCTANISCKAVDFNFAPTTGSPRCWLHVNSGNLMSNYTEDSVTQYRISRCQAGKAGAGCLVLVTACWGWWLH